MTRRRLLAAAIGGLGGAASSGRGWAQTSFAEVLRRLQAKAEAAGLDRAMVASATAGLRPDPEILKRARKQPEFETPIWNYVERAAGSTRVTAGRRAEATWSRQLAQIARRFSPPLQIVLAAWGMEADFTEPVQNADVLRSLATLAWSRAGEPGFATEFVDALAMIKAGVARDRLRGSWAGAMGMPQFMPSAYLRYAVSYAGGGPPDIWRSQPDALSSIASFFAKSGWRRGLPWGFEVETTRGFDWRTLRAPLKDWPRMGLRRADGSAWPEVGEGSLFAPAGANGPSFMLTDNYWVIKTYDNSDSYALSLGLLADRIIGGDRLRSKWPADAALLSHDQRVHLQRGLAQLGLYRGATDGKIGPATRDAVHRFQRAEKLAPADGFATPRVLTALDRRLGSL